MCAKETEEDALRWAKYELWDENMRWTSQYSISRSRRELSGLHIGTEWLDNPMRGAEITERDLREYGFNRAHCIREELKRQERKSLPPVRRIGDVLIIRDATRWYEARSLAKDPRFGNGLGYREYEEVRIYGAGLLYEEDLGYLLMAVNSAMEYPAKLILDFSEGFMWKGLTTHGRLENLVTGKGFRNVQLTGTWLEAEK